MGILKGDTPVTSSNARKKDAFAGSVKGGGIGGGGGSGGGPVDCIATVGVALSVISDV